MSTDIMKYLDDMFLDKSEPEVIIHDYGLTNDIDEAKIGYDKAMEELNTLVPSSDIVLTGSQSYGTPTIDSDWDILIDISKHPLKKGDFEKLGWVPYEPHYNRVRSSSEGDYYRDEHRNIKFKCANHKLVAHGVIINIIMKSTPIFRVWVDTIPHVQRLPRGMKNGIYRELYSGMVDHGKHEVFNLLAI
jgi:hypothetical protein